MGVVAKKIEKVKSLNKRIELFNEHFSQIEIDEYSDIANLLLEKAKHSQEYTEVLSCVGRLNWDGKNAFMISHSMKCNDHPRAAGPVMFMFYKIGLKNEMITFWNELLNSPNFSDPSYQAQMASFGLLFPETKEAAESIIKKARKEDPSLPSICYNKPEISNFPFMSAWI